MLKPNGLDPLKRLQQNSLGLYSLLVIPSLLLWLYYGSTDASLSRSIKGTWQGTLWHFPGLNALASRVLLDTLEALVIVALGWLFYRGYRLLTQWKPNSPASNQNEALPRTILSWTALCGAVLIFTTPFHSSDIFGYLNRGFQQSVFQTNPYLTTISQIPQWQNSPLLHAHWIDNPCPYGFFFARLTDWVTRWSGPSFTGAYLLFKGLNWLLLLASTWLIAKISRLMGHPNPWLAAYCWGANPLVLLHAMGNGHNDIIMVFLLLMALWALLSQRFQWTCLPLLTLSILTKYASLLAAPFILLALWQKKARGSLLLGLGLSALLLLWLGAGYVDPAQPWPWNALLDNAGKPQHSVISLLANALYYPLKWCHAPAKALQTQFLSVFKPLFWVGFASFYGWRLWTTLKTSPLADQRLLREIALVSVVMIAFISAKFHPWYPVMFLPLCLLLPQSSRLRQFALIFSLFQLAGFTILQNLPVISEILLTLVPLWLTLKGSALFKQTEQTSGI
ncbi:hypothetical protein [Vampirovibrio chlorellavorus]|uniref:hypothetical protein n=1 Tax=Vampirovibrio chlorellavorus TaxID=758823 RepID=UPI0026E947C8|nr:hypothetical protein [Vampirovibrio chlorellavorus]